MRMRLVWLAVLLAGGCSIGGGPTLGYRAGRPTVGWEAGIGVTDLDGGQGALDSIHLDAGQSWRDGRGFTYGSLGGDAYQREHGAELFYGAGGAIGAGGGDGQGTRLLLGAAPFVGRITGRDSCETQRVVMLSLGARAVGGDLEVYLAPRFAAVANLCFD
jgi:hypothetical protein